MNFQIAIFEEDKMENLGNNNLNFNTLFSPFNFELKQWYTSQYRPVCHIIGGRNELNRKVSLVARMHAESVTSQNTLQMAATACSTEEIMSFFIEIAII